MKPRTILVGVALILSAGAVQAGPALVGVAKKAGGKNITCATCHVSTSNSKLNPFGSQLKGAKVGGKITAASFKKIEKLDADKDRKMNGAELKAGTNPGKK